MSSASDSGARLRLSEDVGEPLALVVGALRPPQRVEVRQVHHEHRHAGRDDHRNGERLPAHLEQIAQQLAVERGQPASAHHDSSAGARLSRALLDRGDPAVGEPDDAIGHVRRWRRCA